VTMKSRTMSGSSSSSSSVSGSVNSCVCVSARGLVVAIECNERGALKFDPLDDRVGLLARSLTQLVGLYAQLCMMGRWHAASFLLFNS
jgi:hypothetical protein